MRFTILVYLTFLAYCAPRVHAGELPAASIDLATQQGVAAMQGEWRYSDVQLEQVQHHAPDAQGQPTGAAVSTWDIQPHAGLREFDDSQWQQLDPTTLNQRRGNGRLSFAWYRINITIPKQVNEFDTRGATLAFETSIDDYAEVWVDGELPRATGQNGGSVIAGWNANNKVIIGRNVMPGQKIQIAVFGVNGPLSDAPPNFIWMRLARLSFYPGDVHSADPIAVAPQEVNVRITRNDAAINDIVPANAKIFKVAEGFLFTEGPVWVREGGYLLFSDPNANRIYRYDASEAKLSVFRERSGYEGADIAEYHQPGSNGLTLDKQGRVTLDQHGNRRVVRMEGNQMVVLADRYQGKRLNSPNDLVYQSDGSIYFTDPPFGLPKGYDDVHKELSYSGVYRASKGKVILLTKELTGPNGIAFSPDERYLYVDNWDPQHKVVLRFPVKRDGTLGKSEVFADLTQEIPGEEALDGLKVECRAICMSPHPMACAFTHLLENISAPSPRRVRCTTLPGVASMGALCIYVDGTVCTASN
jgi:gluconolactonase